MTLELPLMPTPQVVSLFVDRHFRYWTTFILLLQYSQFIVSARALQYHIPSLLAAQWVSVNNVKNSTFDNYSADPLHRSLMLLETQTGISLIQKIIVRRCHISTSITTKLTLSRYLQTKVVNCAICFGVPGRRLWTRMISTKNFLINTFQGSCSSGVVAGQHPERVSRMLRSHSKPLPAAVEHYVPLKHSQIEARVTLILCWAHRD